MHATVNREARSGWANGPNENGLWIDVDGGRIPVWCTGDGPDRILFLHGWSLNHRVWDAQHDGLSASATVLSIDRRGFGAASAPAALSREPGDILAVLDALDIASVWLVGQSQAARVAVAFALAYPGRVAGLVLQGAPRFGEVALGGKEEIPLDTYRRQILSGDIAAMHAAWLAHPLMHTVDPRSRIRLAALLQDYTGADLIAQDVGLSIDSAIIPSLLIPTLVVTGVEESDDRRAWAGELALRLPIAEFCAVSDSGHLCNLENPEGFNDAIRRFVGLPAVTDRARSS